MYCCLAEIDFSERELQQAEMERFKETIVNNLDATDQYTFIDRRLLLLTSMRTYPEVKQKLTGIRQNLFEKHGPSIGLAFGFAEVKDGGLLDAIDGAKQMLSRTTEVYPISGMYYYRLTEL